MIVVDCETTGTIPEKHSIVALGSLLLLERKDHFEKLGEFYEECRMRDGAVISQPGDSFPKDPGALAINGFTEEQVTDPNKQSLEQLIRKFAQWPFDVINTFPREYVKDILFTLAAHNARFDASFVEDSAKRYGINLPFGYRAIDSFTIAAHHHLKRGIGVPHGENHKAHLSGDEVFKYAGLQPEPRPHNGLTGAKHAAEAISRLIYGKPFLPEFKIYKVPYYLKKGIFWPAYTYITDRLKR